MRQSHLILGLPWWLRWWSVCLQCRRPGFDPWVRKILWRRKWQSTAALLPGKSHGWRSLIGYSPWGHKELDMTERLHFHSSDFKSTICSIQKCTICCIVPGEKVDKKLTSVVQKLRLMVSESCDWLQSGCSMMGQLWVFRLRLWNCTDIKELTLRFLLDAEKAWAPWLVRGRLRIISSQLLPGWTQV